MHIETGLPTRLASAKMHSSASAHHLLHKSPVNPLVTFSRIPVSPANYTLQSTDIEILTRVGIMADNLTRFENLLQRAAKHKQAAEWELAENALTDAEQLCKAHRFPNQAQNQVRVLLERAEVLRRHGKFKEAIKSQEEVIKSKNVEEWRKAKVYGELGVNYRHTDRIEEAANAFQKHYMLAAKLAFEMDAEVCRSTSNLGIARYQLYLKDTSKTDLLQDSIRLQKERISRADNLLNDLQQTFAQRCGIDKSLAAIGVNDTWVSNWSNKLNMWKSIGVSRIVFSYLADGKLDLATKHGKDAVEMTSAPDATWADPTVRALSRFSYGYALMRNDQAAEAKIQFAYPAGVLGKCTPAIALCKESSDENRVYLQEVIRSGADLAAYDEVGYSALDYAVFADDLKTTTILKNALASQIGVDKQVEELKMAEIRKHFREIFHAQFRPILQDGRDDCIKTLRAKYSELLKASDSGKRKRFDVFRLVSYRDFEDQGALPRWGMEDKLAEQFDKIVKATGRDPFVIFMSYRWIGRESDPPIKGPDSADNYQYRRMLNALDQIRDYHPKVKAEDMYIWLDCACIDQDDIESGRRERGINALPIVVAQCDAMISIVDKEYPQRAWCAVETMIVQTLKESSSYHHWYEHKLHDADAREEWGALSKGPAQLERFTKPSTMRLTVESDRRYIEFLERQSMLLGRTGAKS
ncbi:hypothetical protein AC579_10358 [Pseudocercospora musae]|uniref:Uncharacterized protein n=1 Tax=Pseudocercospora musae TaxID=113226 RepID=A0A139ICN7_9PEZI|nr:hypothetical protein AC579_10358 [Pseudocercospora musae]